MVVRIVIAVLSLASAAFAQTPTPALATPTPGDVVYRVVSPLGLVGLSLDGVPGQPFSAHQETETIQTLADGTHITHGVERLTWYRDTSGRVRTERTAPTPPGFPADARVPVFVDIVDPVAGYRYSFSNDPANHSVHRMPYSARTTTAMFTGSAPGTIRAVNGARIETATGAWTASSAIAARPVADARTESLGTQNLEGVLAEGTRRTATWPVGSVGNDRPITVTTEVWTSRELGIELLRRNSDPRTGDTTLRVTGISRSEPDPSLFQPPAGSEVVTENQ